MRSNPLNAAAIVICRLNSQRLPGKVLRPAQGQPLLAWVVDRVARVRELDRGLIIATSDRAVDDAIAQFCDQRGLALFRGSAHDVSQRVLACAEAEELDWFARVNADSPFVEPSLLGRACRIATSGQYDFITNLCPRTFPYGVSVELVRVAAYRRAYRRMSHPAHFEHVTKILYDLPRLCRRYNITRLGADLSQERLTVDTPDDWKDFARLAALAADKGNTLSYEDALRSRKSYKEAA